MSSYKRDILLFVLAVVAFLVTFIPNENFKSIYFVCYLIIVVAVTIVFFRSKKRGERKKNSE
ncbi:hypothetical protein [Paenibacillus sp. WLX2291]|uniref:hypothetical protein n=1 Tax=Paenibacillus sp. WLX2291 TaxID=3296934 RepID=UPI003983E1B0